MVAGVVGRRLSSDQWRDLWQRWQKGQSLSEIGRALGGRISTVYGVLRAGGGIAPLERKRAPQSLTLAEREATSRGLVADRPFSHIATELDRSPSTIGREVARNGGRLDYRAAAADEQARLQARRAKQCHLARHPKLARLVAGKLRMEWSPQQISA